MSLEVKGMMEVVDYMDLMLKSTESNGALNEAGEHIKKVEQETARKIHNKYSENIGWKELKKYPISVRSNGTRIVSVGIRGRQTKKEIKKEKERVKAKEPRATYWDRIKGLWYNNYGFLNARTGEYVAGSDWMNIAYEDSAEKAYEIVKEGLLKEMGL